MNKVRISKKYILAAVILLSVVCLVATGGVFAKYISTLSGSDDLFSATAKEFYFESNYLTSDDHEYKLNAGTESVTIELYNFENEFRKSQMNCKYTISVNFSGIDETPENIPVLYIDGVKQSGPINVGGGNSTTTKLELKNLKKGATYMISVLAEGGYSKTLSARFTIANDNGFYMNVKDAGEYVLLTVWTENVSGDMSIRFPDGLIPDATDPILATINNYSDGHYNGIKEFDQFKDGSSFAAPYSSHAYRFFKTADYNLSDAGKGIFAIKLNGTTVETSTNIP